MENTQDMQEAGFERAPSLTHAIRQNALRLGGQEAVTFVRNPEAEDGASSWSYTQLDFEARRAAAWLQARFAEGERILLLYPTGLEFVRAFLACLYAGMVAVPAPLPGQHGHQQRRVRLIAQDAGIAAIFTDSANFSAIAEWAGEQDLAHLPCLATDTAELAEADAWTLPALRPSILVMLQYTSGSTGEPKGVMVTHRNLLANVDSLRRAYGLDAQTRFGGWIPLYHDMGLMGLLLPALLLGSACVLMAPTAFLKRPHWWLRMMDRFDIGFTAAPNFAYELCAKRVADEQMAGLDLSRWRFAANGSEPVQAATLFAFAERFAAVGFKAETLCPCFGMAEATLFVSGQGHRRPLVRQADAERLEQQAFSPAEAGRPLRELVSCGPVRDLELRIVDPLTCEELPAGRVGEIWLRGRSVTRGYWRNEPATLAVFGATTAAGEAGFLRSGDLGVCVDGEVYVTGRIKEMIVVHGRNLYPQDIEHEIRARHAELSSGVGAAFTVLTPHEEIVVTHEVRGRPDRALLQDLASGIKTTIARELGVSVGGVVLLKPGGVLRTTSGKIQRSAMREMFLVDGLAPLYEDVDPHVLKARRPREALPAGQAMLRAALGEEA
jgi:acyl-CoA synthetase (AMP-forming)/AMP-acid ligase II